MDEDPSIVLKSADQPRAGATSQSQLLQSPSPLPGAGRLGVVPLGTGRQWLQRTEPVIDEECGQEVGVWCEDRGQAERDIFRFFFVVKWML